LICDVSVQKSKPTAIRQHEHHPARNSLLHPNCMFAHFPIKFSSVFITPPCRVSFLIIITLLIPSLVRTLTHAYRLLSGTVSLRSLSCFKHSFASTCFRSGSLSPPLSSLSNLSYKTKRDATCLQRQTTSPLDPVGHETADRGYFIIHGGAERKCIHFPSLLAAKFSSVVHGLDKLLSHS